MVVTVLQQVLAPTQNTSVTNWLFLHYLPPRQCPFAISFPRITPNIMSDNALVEIPFAATFPLPFRVLFLAGMGILGWATNLHGLHILGIDFASALEFRKTTSSSSSSHGYSPLRSRSGFKMVPDPATVYKSIYRLSFVFVAWCLVCWSMFRVITQGDVAMVDVFRYLPAICALGVLIVLISPFDALHKRERDMFLK